MSTPRTPAATADTSGVEPWVEIRVLIPRSWKRWLEEAGAARALSVSALVRQCIRELMIRRHDTPANGGTP